MADKPISQLSQSEVDEELDALIAAAGPDECRVLLFICRRFVAMGQRDIGKLDLATEKRDGFQETAEEAADGLFYMSLRFLLAQVGRRYVAPESPLQRPCEVCGAPGPVKYNDVLGSKPAKNLYRYCCQRCHGNPDDPFFTRRRSTPISPARYHNEAGQLVEDDDAADEDWP
jgi:hypothetical protein